MNFQDVIEKLEKFFSNHEPEFLKFEKLEPAAVLVLFYQKRGEPHLVFISRSRASQTHRGEVAFPGGRFEDGVDDSLEDTAIREAEEEVGVPTSQIKVLGRMDDIWTITGYKVTPFVAVAREPVHFTRQVEEVAGILEVPLEHLLDEDNFQESVARWTSTKYPLFFFFWNDAPIFGATAYILFDILYNAFEFRPRLRRSVENLKAIKHDADVIRQALALYEKKREAFSRRKRR
ncbi:MAG: NUDIX hydrolase [Promethearchaeota archaeon]